MSRTGNKIININEKVDMKINGSTLTIKGPNGELTSPLFNELNYQFDSSSLQITRKSDDRFSKQKHGLSRTLIANAQEGVLSGFEKQLILQGIGYRVQLKGSDLEFSLGYSHPILFKAPENIKFKVEGQNKFTVFGIDKSVVGQVCSDIKKLRKKDSYKGKGIFFIDEKITKKPGKSIKK